MRRCAAAVIGIAALAGCAGGSAPSPSADPSATSSLRPPASPTATATPAASQAASDAATGRIAFVSSRDGDLEIFVVSSDGSSLLQLTNNTVVDGAPVWSPDGKQIAYLSGSSHPESGHLMNADVDLWVMNADGSNARRVAGIEGEGASPAWSPDGTLIAFDSSKDGHIDIFVAALDGSATRRLTENGADNFQAAWSPDGSRIAYASNVDAPLTPDEDTRSDIFVMDADGQNVKRLTDNEAVNLGPQWSPDGTRIAFVSKRDGFDGDILVMDDDGSNVVQLTSNGYDDFVPSWSPDGSRIAFASDPTSSWAFGLSVMDADGSDARRLTDTGGDVSFSWSPDGTHIAFFGGVIGDEGEPSGIYVVDAYGTQVTRVVDDVAWDSGPAWCPVLPLQ